MIKIIIKVKDIICSIYLKLLFRFTKDKIIIFELASKGELQFFEDTLLLFLKDSVQHSVYIAHTEDTVEFFKKNFSFLNNKVKHIKAKYLKFLSFPEVDIYLTTEQHHLGLSGAYSVCLFHGMSAKGVTFSQKVLDSFDCFFFHGPLHLSTYHNFFLKEFKEYKPTHKIYICKTGYPKLDNLLNRKYKREQILKKLGANVDKKTILYAPAFNEGASLRVFGLDIIRVLSKMHNYNVIVKLPIECCLGVNNTYATGGVLWFEAISKIININIANNIYLYNKYRIDPVLECADVLIGCVSSVNFEFLLLKKPIITIDTPLFYSKFLHREYPNKKTNRWKEKLTVNAGCEFGPIVKNINNLAKVIDDVFDNYSSFPYKKNLLDKLLIYNKGRGALFTVKKIYYLINKNLKTTVPYNNSFYTIYLFMKKRISERIKILLHISCHFFFKTIRSFFLKKGYAIERIGLGYLDKKKVVNESKQMNLTVCEYLEFKKNKIGRRDAIFKKIIDYNILNNNINIIEIGPGAGIYLEKIFQNNFCKCYEIYETNLDWKAYLVKEYSHSIIKLIAHQANGLFLNYTHDLSVNFVHAHAVFVYLPILIIFSYIQEAARVLITGGHLLFNCFLESEFTEKDIHLWTKSKQFFPVIIPDKLLFNYTEQCGFELIDKFNEPYGPSISTYILFQKKHKL